MTVELYKDLIFLVRNQSIPILSREKEQDPLEILEKSFTDIKKYVSPPITALTKFIEQADNQDSREIHPLHNCIKCEDAIAPKSGAFQIYKKISLPILILLHNENPVAQNQYYSDSQENMLFIKMITRILRVDPKNILIREVLRCYFSQHNLYNPIHLETCMKYLHEEIHRYSIKGILVIGSAAKILFSSSDEFQRRYQRSSKWMELPLFVSPGPQRILYMEQKKMDVKLILKEKKNIQQIWNSLLNEINIQ